MISTTVVYSNQKTGFMTGLRYSNPRFFNGTPRDGIAKVIIVGDWPAVERAYRAAGIEVVKCDLKDVAAAAGKAAAPATPKATSLKEAKPSTAVAKGDTATAAPTPVVKHFTTTKGNAATTITEPSVPAAPETAPVAIPPEWQKLQWPSLRALAADIAGRPVINKEEATGVINAELTKRAQQ